MGQTTAKKTPGNAVEIWDLYCSGKYGEIEEKSSYFLEDHNRETAALVSLARLELKPANVAGSVSKENGGLFYPLLSGMLSYYRNDFIDAAESLGSWLLEKDYSNRLIVSRFSESALKASRFSLILKVYQKYADDGNYKGILAGPAMVSFSETGMFREALQLWNRSSDSINDTYLVQKAAFVFMENGHYKDAEKILLELYYKVTGHPYQLDYMAARSKYRESIRNISILEKSPQTDYESMMELGMAYLFSEEYEKARRVFEELQKKFR